MLQVMRAILASIRRGAASRSMGGELSGVYYWVAICYRDERRGSTLHFAIQASG
jgi:hypothetical protein